MSIKLARAFKLTEEEHADAFERFANAFLVDDDPGLKALGGKKDKGMDAYVYDDLTGKVTTVVQSCVSPASRARTKVLGTVAKLKANQLLPEVLVYCTPADIGTALDKTKQELRRDEKVTLDVCDAAWFVARHQTTQNRAAICETYARETLEPFVRDISDPDKLYHLALGEHQQRVAIQYLEAVNLDRAKDSSLTKGIFDALIACVTRDSDPPHTVYSEAAIVAAICGMLPAGHAGRVIEIVPGRIQHLVGKKALHFHKAAGGYVLAFDYREKVRGNIARARDCELAFLAALAAAVRRTADERAVDYDFSAEKVAAVGHQAVLWYLREQGKAVSDPAARLLNILNAEKLLDEFLAKHPVRKAGGQPHATEEQLRDLLPHALYVTLSTNDEEVRRYLRAKADLFIVHGFLQATPDVQDACRKLLAGDILYLDTTVLIRCIAEHYSTGTRKPLLDTLAGAKQVGYQLRTWRPYIGELVSHLRNRVELEWSNHYRPCRPEELSVRLRTARTLIRVFCDRAQADGRSLPEIVAEILGTSNEQENAVEFLGELFNITTQELPRLDGDDDEVRGRALEAWSRLKRRPENVPPDRFRILVENDVNSYVSILRVRRELRPQGPNYGHKVWYLSTDSMPWRIARTLAPKGDAAYEVAMSFGYLMNYAATLAVVGRANLPAELIPATTILEESERVPDEVRAIYEKEVNLSDKPFLQMRRLRDLTHQLKSSGPLAGEPLEAGVELGLVPEEDI